MSPFPIPVERVLTVAATCRQQGRNVLEFLTDCFRIQSRGLGLPSLVPQPDRLLQAS